MKEDLQSVFQKCEIFHAHNVFLGVIEHSDKGAEKVQKLLKGIPAGMTCNSCSNHSYMVNTNYLPAQHFLMSGKLDTVEPTSTFLGKSLFAFGVLLFIVMLALHFVFKVSVINKNFGNLTVAISTFMVAAAIIADGSSSKLARLSALAAASAAIFFFFANFG